MLGREGLGTRLLLMPAVFTNFSCKEPSFSLSESSWYSVDLVDRLLSRLHPMSELFVHRTTIVTYCKYKKNRAVSILHVLPFRCYCITLRERSKCTEHSVL